MCHRGGHILSVSVAASLTSSRQSVIKGIKPIRLKPIVPAVRRPEDEHRCTHTLTHKPSHRATEMLKWRSGAVGRSDRMEVTGSCTTEAAERR